jgi:hypothetical protein
MGASYYWKHFLAGRPEGAQTIKAIFGREKGKIRDIQMTAYSKEDVLALLLSLGETAEEVRAQLIKKEIKGQCNKSWGCPIAVFLERSKRSVGARVSITDHKYRKYGESVFIGINLTTNYSFCLKKYPELEGIFQFIQNFDVGMYEELIG